jgi:hypothetical protein
LHTLTLPFPLHTRPFAPLTPNSHAGAEAAEHLERHLLAYLCEAPPSQLAAAPGAALAAAVERAEAALLPALAAAGCNAGSTLLAALLLDDMLHVANGRWGVQSGRAAVAWLPA